MFFLYFVSYSQDHNQCVLGDSLEISNYKNFSTPDQDNDNEEKFNLASFYSSGGWFGKFSYANPNGQYIDFEKTYEWILLGGSQYIFWYHWKKSFKSLKSTTLMIRPSGWDIYDNYVVRLGVF